MIDALYACVDECGAVKEEYLDGHMTDKDAKNKIDEITNRYAPVLKSLENADSRGDLNYDQHKAAHPTNPVECCADANPKTMLPNDT